MLAVAYRLFGQCRYLVVPVACVFAFSIHPGHAQKDAQTLDLHLVLAVDVSASVNDKEFDLQRSGTAEAFRDRDVQAAIASMADGMAVSVVQWSSVKRQAVGLEWHRLETVTDAMRFADTVEEMARKLPGGGTMIHAGLAFAAQMLESAPGTAHRRVIDIAGNGEADDLVKTLAERDRLIADGIIINGLPIEELKGNLTRYFKNNVIGGPGSFVVTAEDFDDFRRAMRLKLLREISGLNIAGRLNR